MKLSSNLLSWAQNAAAAFLFVGWPWLCFFFLVLMLKNMLVASVSDSWTYFWVLFHRCRQLFLQHADAKGVQPAELLRQLTQRFWQTEPGWQRPWCRRLEWLGQRRIQAAHEKQSIGSLASDRGQSGQGVRQGRTGWGGGRWEFGLHRVIYHLLTSYLKEKVCVCVDTNVACYTCAKYNIAQLFSF